MRVSLETAEDRLALSQVDWATLSERVEAAASGG